MIILVLECWVSSIMVSALFFIFITILWAKSYIDPTFSKEETDTQSWEDHRLVRSSEEVPEGRRVRVSSGTYTAPCHHSVGPGTNAFSSWGGTTFFPDFQTIQGIRNYNITFCSVTARDEPCQALRERLLHVSASFFSFHYICL